MTKVGGGMSKIGQKSVTYYLNDPFDYRPGSQVGGMGPGRRMHNPNFPTLDADIWDFKY